MTALRLALARHGQTDSNVRRALDSRPPGAPLNDVGRTQAAALAQRLAVEPVTAVHASVAVRAQQTAAPVAAAHGLEVGVVDGAHEIFVGDLEGRADKQARERFEEVYRAWQRGDLDVRLPGGESARELRERFVAAIEGITASATGTVVLVSHGAAIRLGAAALIGDTAENAYLGNTGIVVLEAGVDGWRVEHWDPGPPHPGDVTAGGHA